jgi:hypothetical protein
LEEDWKQNFYRLCDEWTTRTVIFKEGQKWGSILFYFIFINIYFIEGMVAGVVSSLYMMSVVIIGWNAMDVAKAAVAINSALVFGFLGTFLVQQNVELERCDKNIVNYFFLD